MTDTKFPEALREYSGKSELTIYLFEESGTDAYSKSMVDRWFKRCIEDFPENPKGNTTNDVLELAVARGVWFGKWFSQFKEEEE